jgi:hypothetical protein
VSRLAFAIASVSLIAGCSSGTQAASTNADITKVVQVKSSFGPEYKVADIGERAIDPKLLASRELPDGLAFDPANCAKVAVGPDMPPDLQGNMTAVSAEGNGIRYVVIAVETSKPLPVNDPGKGCAKVRFSGAGMRGGVDVIDAPDINDAHTLGVHRVVQTLTPGAVRAGELYDYSAQFGDYQVIVTANPVPVPDQPPAKVDVQRARDLLVKAVGAIRS